MMEKPADTQHPIYDLLKRRWSPRAFSDQPVEAEKLHMLFEAARWAPSSNNEQPWRFIVATKDHETEWNRLLACLVEGNRKWAYRAPALILSVASLNFQEDSTPNRHAFHDTGMAVENLVLQATARGLSGRSRFPFRPAARTRIATTKPPAHFRVDVFRAVGRPSAVAVS